mgnify:FL=1
MPLDKSDDMGDWIKDFYKSDAPQFKGKSKEKRRQMAIAAKLNAENVLLRDTDITLSEKRAFILAARQAYADGKKSFVFKEKTFPCTIKEDDNLFSELTDYLITKKEQFGKAVESTDQATGNPEDDGEAPSPDISDDELEKAADMSRQRMQKFGYEDSDVTGRALPEKLKVPDVSDRGTAGHKKFVIFRAKVYRKLKIKTKGEKFAVDDLLTLFDPNQIMKAQKQHPSGFKSMLNKMYPRENKKLDKGDFTAYDVFIDRSGKEVPVKEDKELPPHTDIQVESNFRGLSNKDANDHMKFHKVGKPVVAYIKNTDNGAMGDILFYTDGNNVIIASGNRQDGMGRDMSTQDKIISFEPLKGNLKSFASSWVKKNGRDYDFKLDKVADKARVFSNSGADNFFAPRGFPTTKVRIKEEVEYHDRESMPSAVDDAADVMSSYTKFLKSTKSYY